MKGDPFLSHGYRSNCYIYMLPFYALRAVLGRKIVISCFSFFFFFSQVDRYILIVRIVQKEGRQLIYLNDSLRMPAMEASLLALSSGELYIIRLGRE